jgi:hypothetical protein
MISSLFFHIFSLQIQKQKIIRELYFINNFFVMKLLESRHSLAHILAQAIQRTIDPDVRL